MGEDQQNVQKAKEAHRLSDLSFRAPTVPVSFRVSPLAKELLRYLAAREGLNTTGYIETVLRQKGREAGLDIDMLNQMVNYPSNRHPPGTSIPANRAENDPIDDWDADPPDRPPLKVIHPTS